MHVDKFLHKFLSSVIHKKRLTTLVLLTTGLLGARKLSVTQLGRAIPGINQERSGIRRSDRFIGNRLLHAERTGIYKKTIDLLIQGKQRPKLVVDWSPIPNTTMYLLRAGLVTQGRALTLYEEVYSEKQQNNPCIENAFLVTLSSLMPPNCRPIVLTDAGFHMPWFMQVVELGWDYVGRIRGSYQYSLDQGETWLNCRDLLKNCTRETAECLGEVLLGKAAQLPSTLHRIKEKGKGRIARTKSGEKQRRTKSQKYSQSAKEPWLLCTSLEGESHLHTLRVRKLYKKRMQIEESFRDLKSARYGLSFEHAFSRSAMRIENLLLIAMLATLFAILVGWAGEKKDIHRQFQPGSGQRRVLSLFYLGCRILNKRIEIGIGEIFLLAQELFMQGER
jgi:hypothetical protein